jgi:preprotein translocase subunit SecB
MSNHDDKKNGNGKVVDAEQNKPVSINFTIQRIYTKDLSFESPQSPKIFNNSEWKPEVNIELSVKNEKLADNTYEVLLLITVTLNHEKKAVLITEVKQAGIFTVEGVEGEQLKHLLASYCPNILFPYAREVISDIVVRGGFPQLLLAPVNFDALYEESKKRAANA